MKLRILSLVILVSGAALFAGSIIKGQKSRKKSPTVSRSFVVQYLLSHTDNGGGLTPYEYDARAVGSTGEWKETRYSFKGSVSTWGGTSDGLYTVSGALKQYLGDYNLESARAGTWTEQEFTSSPQFVRSEELLGLRTFVMKDAAGDMEIEINSSPETGITPLKKVIRSRSGDGNDFVDVKEAISIQFRDLSEDEVRLPDLPVRFDIAEEKARSLKAAGQYERSEALEQAIQRLSVK